MELTEMEIEEDFQEKDSFDYNDSNEGEEESKEDEYLEKPIEIEMLNSFISFLTLIEITAAQKSSPSIVSRK